MKIDFYITEIVITTKKTTIELIRCLQFCYSFSKYLNDGPFNRWYIQLPFLDILIVSDIEVKKWRKK
jgi:hypothetical protein